VSLAQPYVVNEKVEKVFSEGFTDINKNFIITSSSNPKFWGIYGDGYYYMKRKIASPRAIIVNADETSKNFYIKTKINLASTGTMQSSVGLIFLAQKGGKGGFVFELNKRKKFRIKELGTGAFITKEGVNGWLKSKIIAYPERDNTIEIKGFRGKFDIYINGNYLYSFLNNSYEKGKFGAYIGPNAEAKIFYFNVYKLDIPGVEPEVNLDNLKQQIESLKNENDSLKTIVLMSKYNNDDITAISAIEILEKQLQTINEENAAIKAIVKKYELSSSMSSDSVNKFQSEEILTDLKIVRIERDSISDAFSVIQSLYDNSKFIQDSLENEIMKNKTKIGFMDEELSQLKLEIAESKLIKGIDSSLFIPKLPSKPSEIIISPKNSIDSIGTKYLEKSLPNKTDLSDKKFNKSSIDSSKYLMFAVRPELRLEDSINTYPIDSLANSESKLKTSINIVNDSINISLADSTHKISNDSNLLQLAKNEFENLPSDTLKNKKQINLPPDTVGAIELLKKDSIYFHTLDIDEGFELDKNKFVPSSIDSSKSVKIKVNKTELKD